MGSKKPPIAIDIPNHVPFDEARAEWYRKMGATYVEQGTEMASVTLRYIASQEGRLEQWERLVVAISDAAQELTEMLPEFCELLREHGPEIALAKKRLAEQDSEP